MRSVLWFAFRLSPGIRRRARPRGSQTRPRATRTLWLECLESRNLPGFLAPLSLEAGNSPRSVAVGDFNGDGTLDLAMANYYSNNVSVLVGQGDGTFRPAVNFAAGSHPSSVAVGDFNGDGIPDLVTNTEILLGNGD